MFTSEEEQYILDSLKQIRAETHENNIILRQIIKYLSHEIAYANQENDNDFMRNILANLISSGIDINQLFRRR